MSIIIRLLLLSLLLASLQLGSVRGAEREMERERGIERGETGATIRRQSATISSDSSSYSPYSSSSSSSSLSIVDQLQTQVRSLMSSNCLTIERGTVSKYYECIGCRVELAQACIDDMRHNKSLSVPSTCHMSMMTKAYETEECCPRFIKGFVKKKGVYVREGKLNMDYIGSAYPETLRCLVTVGCESSVVYSQLLEECMAVCPGSDPRTGGSLCFSQFNSSPRGWIDRSIGREVVLVVLAVVGAMLLL